MNINLLEVIIFIILIIFIINIYCCKNKCRYNNQIYENFIHGSENIPTKPTSENILQSLMKWFNEKK